MFLALSHGTRCQGFLFQVCLHAKQAVRFSVRLMFKKLIDKVGVRKITTFHSISACALSRNLEDAYRWYKNHYEHNSRMIDAM